MPARNQAHLAVLPIDSPERKRLPPLLRRAWYGLNQAFRRRVAHLDITPDQFTVMRILLEAGARGLTQRELTDAMSSDPNTVASLIERMEQAGLVERRPHARDRRAHQLQLQPIGRKKYEAARELAVALQAEVLSALTRERQESFLAELAELAESCHAALERSPRRSPRRPE